MQRSYEVVPKKEDLPVLGNCHGVQMKEGLSKPESWQYKYRSSGGVDMTIARGVDVRSMTVALTYEPFPDHFVTVEFWGDGSASHENLNGKHIKDRIGNSRTIIFPDGTKVTLVSTGPEVSLTAISIYDGAIAHHINLICNEVEYSNSGASIAKLLDDLQADGETSTFETNGSEFMLFNTYTEDTPGNKVYERVDLGSIEEGKPKLINDYYDDPRIGHT